MNIKLVVNEGYPGLYAINFWTEGTYSEAILFKTNFPPASIDILQ